MTKKRFEYYEHKGADYILDTPNKSLDFIEMLGDCLEAEEIVDLLNELHEENEHLKYNLSAHMVDLNNYKGKCSALEIENEQLKKALDNCQFRTLDLLDYIKEKDVVTHQEIKDWWNNEVMK